MNDSVAAGITVSAATGLLGTAAKAEPKRGGTFRIARHGGSTGDKHNPASYVSFADIALAHTFRAYWSDVWLKKPWMMSNWGARPIPDVKYTLTYKSGGPWNETYCENDRFNELPVMGKGALDDTKRREIYREMGMILRDDSGAVIPYFPDVVYGRRKTVKHVGQLAHGWWTCREPLVVR